MTATDLGLLRQMMTKALAELGLDQSASANSHPGSQNR